MGIFNAVEEKAGFVKAGFLGFGGSGKTLTSALLASAIHREFKCKKPVAFFDTETGFAYVRQTLKTLTGLDPISCSSRSFTTLLTGSKELCNSGVEILIADSMTHIWRDVCAGYLKGVNAIRLSKGQKARTKLEFQDWGPIKDEWAKWTDFFLTSPMHIIICGRAGYEYEMQVNEETERKELIKTGIKMKTEGEFGFEPSLVVEMEQIQKLGDSVQVFNKALVLKDRFNILQGQTMNFRPNGNIMKDYEAVHRFFLPFIKALTPGAATSLNTDSETKINVNDDGNTEWRQELQQREIICEEIKGEFVKAGMSGTGKEETQKRTKLLEEIFNTTSWKYVSEKVKAIDLCDGLDALRIKLGTATPVSEPEPQESLKQATGMATGQVTGQTVGAAA